MTKYKLTIQYDGTRYHGWQIQAGRVTIQGAIKEALARLVGQQVPIVGAGRTDAGVHALGQVAHIRLDEPMDPGRLERALNGILPWDIRILKATKASAAFHAQKHARKKRYVYSIFQGPILPPFLHGRVCHVRYHLAPERMRAAAGLLVGRRDFSGFAAASTSVQDHRRTILRSDVIGRGPLLRYVVEADGFLHHMVRNIVGTLLEIGAGKRAPEDLLRILESGDRRQAGPTAPPQGLCLVKIWYR
jgi:tRNA pseudouridine38-40 synthase